MDAGHGGGRGEWRGRGTWVMGVGGVRGEWRRRGKWVVGVGEVRVEWRGRCTGGGGYFFTLGPFSQLVISEPQRRVHFS